MKQKKNVEPDTITISPQETVQQLIRQQISDHIVDGKSLLVPTPTTTTMERSQESRSKKVRVSILFCFVIVIMQV